MKKVKDLTNIVHALAVSGEAVETDPTVRSYHFCQHLQTPKPT